MPSFGSGLFSRLFSDKRRGRRNRHLPPRVVQLEDRLAPATVSWTGGANTLNWGDGANWSTGSVPGSGDSAVINQTVSGSITISAHSYAVGSLNDTTASLAITAGGSLALAAGSSLGQNVTVNSGTSLSVGASASLALSGGVTLQDNGTVSFASGDTVSLNGNQYYGPTSLTVGSGGRLQANGTTFSDTNDAYARVYLDNGNLLQTGALTGNAFDLPFYVPAGGVQYLGNNLHFEVINILPGTLTNGQILALNAIGSSTPPTYVFVGTNASTTFTVAAGGKVTVAPNLTVSLPGGITLQDNGTVSFASGDTVSLNGNQYYGPTSLTVGNGGRLQANGATFSDSNDNYSRVYLDNGNRLQTGDLTGNAFDLPFYVPAGGVQYLGNNLGFRVINILPGTLLSGQTLALNAIGSSTPPTYVFVGTNAGSTFTVESGATVTVASYLTVSLPGGITLQDNGTVSFGSGDAVSLNGNQYYGSTSLSVGSGGRLEANGTTFSDSNDSYSRVYLGNGNLLQTGDLVGNTFDTPLYLPAGGVQYLANNLSFGAVNILPGTLASGQTLALRTIGTSYTGNQSYVFATDGSATTFTVSAGAVVKAASGVNVSVGYGATLQDNGTVSFASGDSVSFLGNIYGPSSLNVGNGGLLSVSSSNVSQGDSNVYVGNGGSLQATYSTFTVASLTLDSGASAALSQDTLGGGGAQLTINSGASVTISNNDLSTFGNASVIAVGSSTAHINLTNNYWGTTDPTGLFKDNRTDSTRPTIDYSPVLSSPPPPMVPPVLTPIPDQSVSEGSTVSFSASASDSDPSVTLTYSLDPGAPAGAVIDPATGLFSYTPDDGPAVYTIWVRVTDSNSPSLSAVLFFTLTVNNVPPTATIQGPTDGFKGVPGQVRDFLVSATDPSQTDQAAGFSYDVSWGDGTADTLVQGPGGPTGTHVTHVFTAAGTYTITATATDKDGGLSGPVSVSDTIVVAELQNGTLMVGGTSGNDTFGLTPGAAANAVALTVNGASLGTFSTNGQCQVLGDGGSGDVLNFNDQANAVADPYLITASTVGRTHAATVTFSNLAALNVKAGTAANTIAIQGTALGTTVKVTTGGGNNSIAVGSAGNTLDGLQGALTVAGGSGNNTLALNDQGALAQSYTITANAFLRSGAARVTYTNMNGVTLKGSKGTTTVTITTAPTTPVTVTGGGGTTKLVGPNVPTTWTVSGANSGTVANVTYSVVPALKGGLATDTFQMLPGGSVSGTIDGGGGKNWLDYSAYTGPVSVNLSGSAYGSLPAHSATGVRGGAAAGIVNVPNARAGSGDATLVGGGGNILVGGAGNNTLVDRYAVSGASGGSLLIGGSGTDSLTGGKAGDLLIGGTTTYDAQSGSLQDILAYWNSHNHNAAFTALQAGLPTTHEQLVWGTTVTDDASADVLTGTTSTTAIDWFFAGVGDTVNHGKPGTDYLNNGPE
jgi:hypothetical protein